MTFVSRQHSQDHLGQITWLTLLHITINKKVYQVTYTADLCTLYNQEDEVSRPVIYTVYEHLFITFDRALDSPARLVSDWWT